MKVTQGHIFLHQWTQRARLYNGNFHSIFNYLGNIADFLRRHRLIPYPTPKRAKILVMLLLE